jgi:iron complex outermembrane receptor protein
MRSTLLASTALFAAAGSIALPGAAFAQTAPPADTSAQVGEVVVTAERFASTVQKTPVAVSAFTPQTLADRQVTSIEQIGNQIPGLVISPATGSSSTVRIVLRGADEEQGGINFDPSVGIYIDNVYQPRLNGSFFDFFDVSSVEVLRGPQGTLYGKNTAGGAIKIQTASPTSYWTGSGDVAYGSYNMINVRGLISGPIIPDILSVSVSGVSRQRDGYTYDPYYSRDLNNVDRQAWRTKFLFTPAPKVRIEASVDYEQDNSDPAIGVPLQVGTTVNDPAVVPNRNLFTSELYGPERAHIQSIGASINGSYEVSSDLSLTSTTGYRNLRSLSYEPFWLTATPPAVLTPTSEATGGGSDVIDYNFSQEFDANYNTEKFKGVAGLYYFYESGFALALPVYSTPNNQNRKTTDYAVFGQGTYQILPTLGLTFGIRATQEQAQFSQYYFTIPKSATFNGLPQAASKTFHSVTPKVGLDWQATPNLLAYFSYTQGYISGGFNPISPTTNTGTGLAGAPTPYGAESVDNYEGGVKFTTDDHKARINLAIFDAEYQGLQLPVFFPGTSNSYTSNASNARIQGIEIEPNWNPVSMLNLYSNMSFETSKYLTPFNCALANNSIVNCEGNKIKGVIPAKIVVGFIFTPQIDMMAGKLRLLGDYDYSAAYYNNVANQIALAQTPIIQLFNASIDWTSPDKHWTVALEGKNLADNHYVLDGLQLGSAVKPTVTGYPGDPRMVDIRVGVKF